MFSSASLGASLSSSVGLFVYPSDGQTAEQQELDDYQCFSWAKGETGFDPINPSAPVKVDAQNPGINGSGTKGALKGAAKGALLGKVIDDDASKGAEIGAALGLLRARKQAMRDAANEAKTANTKNETEHSQLKSNFKKAMSLCLESRKYSVK